MKTKQIKNVTPESGGALIWVVIVLLLLTIIPKQLDSAIHASKRAHNKAQLKSRIAMVGDFYSAQMRNSSSAYHTRMAAQNSAFNAKASKFPNPQETDYTNKDLEVRDSDNNVLIPLEGKYVDRMFNEVASSSASKLYFVKAYWRVPKIDPNYEDMNSVKTEEQLRSHIRVEKIVQVTLASSLANNPTDSKIEKVMGADTCVTVRGKMLDFNPPNDVRYKAGIASCPVGYNRVSGYMVDFEAIANAYRKINAVTYKGYASTYCQSKIDGPWSGAPPKRDELGANFVYRTGDGGVDAARSVLPQHWIGKQNFANEPLNSCYSICCAVGAG